MCPFFASIDRFAYEDEDEDEEVMRLGSMSKVSLT